MVKSLNKNKFYFFEAILILGLAIFLPKISFAKIPFNILVSTGFGVNPQLHEFSNTGKISSYLSDLKNLPSNNKGINLASGDVDGDAVDEIIVSQRAGGIPQVFVFEKNGKLKMVFKPYPSNSQTGINIATGDVDKDGKDEIVTVPAEGGVALVKIYRFNKKQEIIKEFKAFSNDSCGASVAAGDIDHDDKDEIIVGNGPKCSPKIRVYESNGARLPLEFYAFNPNFLGGIDVAAGDVDKDGIDEIGTCQSQQQAWCKIYKYKNNTPLIGSWLAYNNFEVGARIDFADLDSDGRDEVLTGTAHGTPQVRFFEASGSPININFYPFPKNYNSGIDVAPFFANKKSQEKVIYVEDGDSVYLTDGREMRYIGVNTPEVGKKFYEEAINLNKRLVENKNVILEYDVDREDHIGRDLAYVHVGKKFINKILVSKGLAKVDTFKPNVKYRSVFKKAQARAQRMHRGMWRR
ncbi:MAG: FG-GAP-like repeat-containing protein [Patescibacteria group bacterium]